MNKEKKRSHCYDLQTILCGNTVLQERVEAGWNCRSIQCRTFSWTQRASGNHRWKRGKACIDPRLTSRTISPPAFLIFFAVDRISSTKISLVPVVMYIGGNPSKRWLSGLYFARWSELRRNQSVPWPMINRLNEKAMSNVMYGQVEIVREISVKSRPVHGE